MAKLSAHGRTVVAEASITVQSETFGVPFTYIDRLMSDGAVLRKNSNGWKVYGKLKEGITAEQWKQQRQAAGWTVK